jgi:hypothetical protein
MSETAEFLVRAILIGSGATVVMDLWALLLRHVLGIQSLNYALVGRWLGHIARGRVAHDGIGKAAPIAGEGAIGWTAHYAIGIAFAALLLAIAGLDWARAPSLLPALIVGLATIVAPFFVMQPAMGLGFAASKTPNPAQARLRSAATHTVFGIGLYASAVLTAVALSR